jgi:spore maturation protein CgeB
LYASSRAVLNIKNEIAVIRGVNQRSFEPYGCMTPVLNDAVADLELCFELGSEILVYHTLEELHEWHAKLTSDAQFAQKIGLAGHRRTLAHHTYAHRALAILKQVGLK